MDQKTQKQRDQQIKNFRLKLLEIVKQSKILTKKQQSIDQDCCQLIKLILEDQQINYNQNSILKLEQYLETLKYTNLIQDLKEQYFEQKKNIKIFNHEITDTEISLDDKLLLSQKKSQKLFQIITQNMINKTFNQEKIFDSNQMSSPIQIFNIRNLLQQANTLFHDEFKMDKAYELASQAQFILDFLNQAKLFELETAQINEQYELLLYSIKQTKLNADRVCVELDSDNWIQETSNKTMKVYYKLSPGAQSLSIKLESTLDVKLFNILSIFNEVELFKQWMPFMTESKMVKTNSLANKDFYQAINFPLISDREMYLNGVGIDRLDINGTIIIPTRCVHNDNYYQNKNEISIPPQNKLVRMDLHYFAIEITPISEIKQQIRIIVNMDPKLPVIPIVFVNFVTRKMASVILNKILSCASKNFENSIWQNAINQNPKFYKQIDEKLNKYFKKTQIQ